MRAVLVREYGVPPRVCDVAEPACPEDGVVLQVSATGVCRSDWHAWHGHDPVTLPHVPGHEMAGRIASIGPQVRRWQVGDRVTVPFVCGCGRCGWCRAGQPQVCPQQTQPGFTGPGSFAERVALHAADANLVALPDEVEDVAAASLGCRFATAYRALTAHGQVRPGEWVAVHGCGGLGLSAIVLAQALGALVVAVDVAAGAREHAARLGAEVVLDPHSDGANGQPETTAARVREVTGGGAHVSLDALGSPGTAVASVSSLRRRGRHLQVGLLLGADAATALPMDLVIAHELEVYGSHGMAAGDYPALLELVVSGRVDPAALVGRVEPLSAAGATLAAMDRPSRNTGITVLLP